MSVAMAEFGQTRIEAELEEAERKLAHERAERAKDRAQFEANVKGLEVDKAKLASDFDACRAGHFRSHERVLNLEAQVKVLEGDKAELRRQLESERALVTAITNRKPHDDLQIKNLIGARDKAASDCDAMVPVVKRAIELCTELYAGRIDIPFAQANALSKAVTEYKAKL